MKAEGLNTTTLAKKSKIPQTTLQKIVSGKSTNPRPKTLKAIADCFKVPVSKLTEIKRSRCAVPFVSWIEVKEWGGEMTASKTSNYPIYRTERLVSKEAFAVYTNNKLSMLDPSYTTLVFDPKVEPHEGSTVLIQLAERNDLLFKRLYIDVGSRYIKDINPNTKNNDLGVLRDSDRIIATLVEMKMDFEIF